MGKLDLKRLTKTKEALELLGVLRSRAVKARGRLGKSGMSAGSVSV